jgi:hypothetical protein
MSGDAQTWLEAHPYGFLPDEAALATHQLLLALIGMHSLGMSHSKQCSNGMISFGMCKPV